MPRALLRVAFVFAWSLVLAGCSTPPVDEPEADYTEVKPLIYDYGLVFDCVTEAITEEGFQVAKGDRDSGFIETKNVEGKQDLVTKTQTGQRIRARVLRKGTKDFVVRLTATRLERTIGDDFPGEWRYAGKDEVLLERLVKRFDQQVEKRYKPAPEKG